MELYDQLGEKILVLEQCKLRNASVNHQFMEAFGEAHLALERQLLRLEEAGLRLEYLQSNPGASRAEIEIAIADRVSQQHEQLRRLKHDVFMAPYLKKPMSSTSIGENDFLNHRAQVKRRLLEIRMILHPDRLVQHPGRWAVLRILAAGAPLPVSEIAPARNARHRMDRAVRMIFPPIV